MRLRGGPQLRARLQALKKAFKPIGRKWGDAAVGEGRRRVPVRTGRLQKSIRVRHNSQKRTTVAAHYSASFVDAGTKAHEIRPRKARSLVFQGKGGTIFAKKVDHPRTAAQPFREAMAREALRKTPMAGTLIDEWNRAA